jgi:ubiquinone/menaquinone biosynthesis C-methylase UbiE
MDNRTKICFSLSKKLMPPPAERTVDYETYGDWRNTSLTESFDVFSDACITGKYVLDFGCGDGHLSLFLATEKQPAKVLGVDIGKTEINRAKDWLKKTTIPQGINIDFVLGSKKRLPVPDHSIDTLLAFDCLEHVMLPEEILTEWFRVLNPEGRCLIEWFPYKGPWGPHMEALIPIPWAHVLFGEQAMFRAAEAIYDLPEFIPRHWDLDENGNKKANKWRAWSSFQEQGYINKLGLRDFKKIATDTGFKIDRFEKHSFGGTFIRRNIGKLLMSIPLIGEYFVSHVIIELVKPK